MLIIFISSFKGGGAEKVARMLANSAASKVPVIFAYVHGEAGSEAKHNNCTFLKLHAFSTLASLPLFWRLVVRKRPTSIIAFGNSCVMVAAIVRLLTIRNFMLVGSERANLSFNKYLSKWFGLYKTVLRLSFLICDKIHCVSEGTKQDLCKVLDIPKNKVKVIVNPAPKVINSDTLVDDPIADFLSSLEEPTIFAVGRLAPQKNYQLLLSSFAGLQKSKKCNLVIFGKGNQLSTLQSLSEKLGIEERVYFMGFVDSPFRYSKYADLFVLSSIYEGYPNVLVEALSVGMSVVASDCDFGPREILVGNLSDRLFRVGDQRSLTQKMDKYLGVKIVRDAMLPGGDSLAEYMALLNLN